MRVATIAAALGLSVAVASCQAIFMGYYLIGSLFSGGGGNAGGHPAGPPPGPTVGASVTMTPSALHALEAAVLDYTPPLPAQPGQVPPVVTASAGDAVPLTPGVYTPGGALPTLEAARTALAGAAHAPVHPDGHCYVLFVAPATPQRVTLTFYAGDGTEQSRDALTGTLLVDVQ